VTAAHGPGWLGAPAAASHAPRGPVIRSIAALTAGFAVFVGASIAVGMLIWSDSSGDAAPQAQRVIREAGTAVTRTAPTGQLDPASRTASIGPAALELPDDPYLLYPDPMPLEGVLDLFFWAGAPVHPNYDGRHSWSSAVLLGRVSNSAGNGELQAAGRLTMQRLSQTFFGGHQARIGRLTSSDHSVDGHPGMIFSAQVRYSVPNLPSRYDTVTAVLVQLDDGSLVVAASAVPDDTPPAVARQAKESLDTLSIS
jgi:hypothetical protein